MKQSTFTSIVVPVVATVVLMVLSIFGLKAQSSSYSHTDKMSYSFRNTTNEFRLYGIGEVILKTSNSQTIRCEVSVTGYGNDVEEAKSRAQSVEVSSYSEKNDIPELYVKMKRGRYNKRHCKVVTTVYLPNNVTFQHNEDINLMEFIYRIIDKFK